MIRRAAVLTAAVLLLAGCAAVPDPVVVPTPTITEAPLPQPPMGVVGTGTLDSAPFDIRWDGSTFWLSGLETLPVDDYTLVGVSTESGTVGQCLGGYARTYGPPFSAALNLGSAPRVRDATFFVSVSTLGPYSGSCYGQPVISTALITWTMQPLYPDLVVVDSGENEGATGIVTLEGDVPVSYVVNEGDAVEQIAARFGLTDDQLVCSTLDGRTRTSSTTTKPSTSAHRGAEVEGLEGFCELLLAAEQAAQKAAEHVLAFLAARESAEDVADATR